MDECDKAQEEQERALEAALRKRKATLQAVCACWWCQEPIRGGLLFCPGTECARDYERARAIREHQGNG